MSSSFHIPVLEQPGHAASDRAEAEDFWRVVPTHWALVLRDAHEQSPSNPATDGPDVAIRVPLSAYAALRLPTQLSQAGPVAWRRPGAVALPPSRLTSGHPADGIVPRVDGYPSTGPQNLSLRLHWECGPPWSNS